MSAGRLSGKRHETIVDAIIGRSRRRVNMLVREYTYDGPPPGTRGGADDYTQYRNLVAAAMTGDPRFTDNPQAQARLAQLEQQFGPSPHRTQPWGIQVPQSIGTMLRTTEQAQRLNGQAAPPQPTP